MKVLITGGSGHLGRDLVGLLEDRDQAVRVLSRRGPRPGESGEWVHGDLATGEGVAEAVAGVDAIIHAATDSPSAQRGRFRAKDFVASPSDVDVTGTRTLLHAAAREGVSHIVHVSIVGVEESRLPYMRVKLAAEQVVREASTPWSIVRATGFYWLLDRFLANLRRLPVWVLPRGLDMQPCDSSDFARHVVARTLDGAGGLSPDYAGPEAIGLRELAHQYQQERGLRRPIVALPLPEAAARAAGGLPAADAILGPTTWQQWLRRSDGPPASERPVAAGERPGQKPVTMPNMQDSKRSADFEMCRTDPQV
jgi:uncharacterized protein YbjT (DUF2867 family)